MASMKVRPGMREVAMNRFQKPQTFLLGMKRDRPVLFTPEKYDARTGLLHGYDNGNNPVSISVGRSLTPYQPVKLEWEEE